MNFSTPVAILGLCGVALVGSGCSGTAIPSSPSPVASSASAISASPTGSNGLGEVRLLSGGGINSQLAAVKQATAAYHDVSKAVEAGYLAPEAAACVESPAGAMGVHSANPALLRDGVIDALRPEVLLYLPKNGGGFRLVGVEYVQSVLVRSPSGVTSPWFAATQWPSNYTVLTPAPSLFGKTFDGPMAGHEPGMPWHYDLHAWIWAPNPNGDLAQFNPRLSCDAVD